MSFGVALPPYIGELRPYADQGMSTVDNSIDKGRKRVIFIRLALQDGNSQRVETQYTLYDFICMKKELYWDTRLLLVTSFAYILVNYLRIFHIQFNSLFHHIGA